MGRKRRNNWIDKLDILTRTVEIIFPEEVKRIGHSKRMEVDIISLRWQVRWKFGTGKTNETLRYKDRSSPLALCP